MMTGEQIDMTFLALWPLGIILITAFHSQNLVSGKKYKDSQDIYYLEV